MADASWRQDSVVTRTSLTTSARLVMPVVAAAIVSAGLLSWVSGSAVIGAAILVGASGLAGATWLFAQARPRKSLSDGPRDGKLLTAVLDQSDDPVAITDGAGRLVSANNGYRALAGRDCPPVDAWAAAPPGTLKPDLLVAAAKQAWRDGGSEVDHLASPLGPARLRVTRTGVDDDLLVWRFTATPPRDRVAELSAALSGEVGDRLGRAGIMAALVDRDGQVEEATRAWSHRITGDLVGSVKGMSVAEALGTDEYGVIRLAAEGPNGPALRLLHVPFDDEAGHSVFVTIDDAATAGLAVQGGGDLEVLRALLDLVPIRLALIDRDGRLLASNAALRDYVGVGPAVARYPGDLVVPEDKGALADHIRRLSSARASSGDIAVRFVHAPDEPQIVTASSVRQLGQIAVLLAIHDDSAAAPLKAEIAQQNKMEAVGHLAGGVAHDFNNLLTAILGICDLMLMRHMPGDSDFDDIQQIRSNSNRAASMTRHLLAFSRQQTLRPQVVLLPDLLGEVTHLLKRLLGERITLEVEHARDQGAVRVDAQQLEQVVVNLAVNARDAMSGGGILKIETYAVSARDVRERTLGGLPVADYTALRVSDTGGGIPAHVLPKIFDPFFTTKELGKGTGLGLSTVYGIVRQSGGFISVDTASGGGARFTIHLPVHTGPHEARLEPPSRSTARWGEETILLIEDEDSVRSIAERALARSGYTVRSASSGEEALSLLAIDQAIDAVVTDVAMPGMDGPFTVRAIRERLPNVPVLFISGYAEEQARRRIDLDDAAFLPKPFSIAQLTDAVGLLFSDAGR